MSLTADDSLDLPDSAIRFCVAPETDPHYVAGSRQEEEEQARTRLAALVSPKMYEILITALDPNNRTALQFSGPGEAPQLFKTIVEIRSADREALAREKSKEVASRNALIAHVALVDPATFHGVRARIVRDVRMTPSSLILLPRNKATAEDVAVGIAGMNRLRRLYGDEVLDRVEMDVLEFRATLFPAQTEHARRILESAMRAEPRALEGIGDASLTSVHLSPLTRTTHVCSA